MIEINQKRYKSDRQSIEKRSKEIDNNLKSQNKSTFLIKMDFCNLLSYSFVLFIDFYQSFNQKRSKTIDFNQK